MYFSYKGSQCCYSQKQASGRLKRMVSFGVDGNHGLLKACAHLPSDISSFLFKVKHWFAEPDSKITAACFIKLEN